MPIFETVLNGITIVGSIVGTRKDLAEVYALSRRKLLIVYVDCSEGGEEACKNYNITDNFP